MKYQNPHEMPATDLVKSLDGIAPMSRRERLTRWANALEKHGGSLNALSQIEYLSPDERRAYRGTNTPLTVAFNDAALREEGLTSDRLGDAMDFFEMTAEDAHRLLCDCHYMGSMTGSGLAHRIRHYAEHNGGGLWSWARTMLDRG
jgi:hypothetical protein